MHHSRPRPRHSRELSKSTMTDIHAAAQTGYANEALAYAQGRPDYPDGVLQWLQNALGIGAGQAVVDLGAGTGKFTKLLLKAGADVIAVEPVDAMREQLAASVTGAKIFSGSGAAIPLENASVDAVICAQSFHWFATEAALREIHRVLKPGGRLGLVWNVRDDSCDWAAAITAIITPYETNVPRFYLGGWRQAFSGEYFSPLELTVCAHRHVGKPQQVILERFRSVSFIASLPDVEKEKVVARLQALIASHPALRNKETIAFPYRTEAYKCVRLDPPRAPAGTSPEPLR